MKKPSVQMDDGGSGDGAGCSVVDKVADKL
jgi:hypothetical protein